MTITTAKRPRERVRAFQLVPLALGAMLLSAQCRADWKFKPDLELRETYTDNVMLQSDDLAQHELISEVAPGFSLSNNGRRLKMTATARWRLFGYDHKGLDNDILLPNTSALLNDRGRPSSTREYRALGTAMLAEQLLYVDVQAERRRQAVSAFGPLSTDTYSNVNRSDVSTWSVSPYVQHRFGSVAALTARVSRDSVKGGASSFGFGNTMATTRMLQLTSVDAGASAAARAGAAAGIGGNGGIGGTLGAAGTGMAGATGIAGATGTGAVPGTSAAAAAAGSTFGWTLQYSHQDLVSRAAQPGVLDGRSSSENSMVGGRWKVARTVNLTADTGYDRYSYESLGGSATSGKRWSAGFIWMPSSRTSLQASFGRRYFGKTGLLSFNHRSRNTVWTLDYNDEVSTSRSQFLLPASVDTASMLDRMFTAQFPDPVLRQQAVQAYMASTGLPASLADSVNFLTNRYFRDKRLQGAVVWRLSKSNLSLSVFRDERRALSVQQSDSVLLGSQFNSLNDNILQRGATASLSHNLSPRSTATASLDATHARSLTTGIDNSRRTARLSLSRRIGRTASANLEVHHATGTLAQGALALGSRAGYHENAVVANLSVQY